jgi:hypothetical protein
MGQNVKLWLTNEDLINIKRIRAKWPRWGDAQIIRKALAIAAQQIEGEAINEAEELTPFRRDVEDLFGKQDW